MILTFYVTMQSAFLLFGSVMVLMTVETTVMKIAVMVMLKFNAKLAVTFF